MMKKKCIISLPAGKRVFICVLSALLTACILWFFLREPSSVTAYSADERSALSAQMNSYTLSCVMHEEDGTLAVTQEICFQNRTGDTLPDLVLRTYANAFAQEETSPAAIEELYEQTYGDVFSPGSISVQGVWWQDEIVPYAYQDEAQTQLRIDTGSIAPGDAGTLRIMYVLFVPECAYRFGRTGDLWQLGNAFPILSVWQEGAWRTDEYYPIGDPFLSESANWHVTLSLPEDYVPAASCEMKQDKNGLWTGDMLCARDFALVLGKGYQVQERAFGDVRVRVLTQEKDGKGALALCGGILDTLCGLYGKYPYDTLTVAQVKFPFGGMEYPGLVMIGDSYFAAEDDSLEMLLAHEIAHQWFYALAGSDSFRNPWQDEALSQWAALRYVGVRYGADAEERLKYYYVDAPMQEKILGSVTPGSPVSYFGDYMTYDSVVYGRGTALLYAIDAFTEGKADAYLRSYVHQNPFGLYTRSDFEQALSSFAGADLAPLMNDYLDTLMD